MYGGEGASIICAPIGIYQLKEGAYMPNSPNKKITMPTMQKPT